MKFPIKCNFFFPEGSFISPSSSSFLLENQMKCFHPSKLFSAAVKGRSLISMKAVYPTIAPSNRRAWDRKHQILGNLWWNWEPLPISITQNVTEQHIQHLIWSILWFPIKYPPTCPFSSHPPYPAWAEFPLFSRVLSPFSTLCVVTNFPSTNEVTLIEQ